VLVQLDDWVDAIRVCRLLIGETAVLKMRVSTPALISWDDLMIIFMDHTAAFAIAELLVWYFLE
jgi:hypothetical protein